MSEESGSGSRAGMRDFAWYSSTKDVRALPIDPELPAIVAAVRDRGRLVLEAPPGAGKTTRVPRALLDAGLEGEIVILEPRRLAARLAAQRVAEELGEAVGETVGYSVRFEERKSARTRIRFVTEGVLTRRLFDDPKLPGVSVVVLDEFHERHLQGDLALALLERTMRTVRPDLRIIVMSATLDAEPVATYLGAERIRSEGRAYPVETEYEAPSDDRALELRIASAVRKALTTSSDGDTLVFLPGAREIRRAAEATSRIAAEHGADLVALHGDLSLDEQNRAISPGPRRKVVLSTNVAESSITVPGVVTVIDSGLARAMTHSPFTGLGSLDTVKVSRASAKQREGRAGRVRDGRCIRLFTRADFDARNESDLPEIQRTDFSETALSLAVSAIGDLRFLDPPKEAALTGAKKLLVRLGALDASFAATDLGRRMAKLPLSPRLARLCVAGEDLGIVDDACGAAALLSERDVRAGRGPFGTNVSDEPTQSSDVGLLLDKLREVEGSGQKTQAMRAMRLDPRSVTTVEQTRRELRRRCRPRAPMPESPAAVDDALARALFFAFPDRFAKRQKAGARRLAIGGGLIGTLSEESVVRDAPFMLALDADDSRGVLVRLACAVEPSHVLDAFVDEVTEERELSWNAGLGRVEAKTRMLYDGIPFDETIDVRPSGDDVTKKLVDVVMERGLARFGPEGALDALFARARHAASKGFPVRVPDDAELRTIVESACDGKRSLREVEEAGLVDWIFGAIKGGEKLASLCPESIALPSGRRAKVTYEADKPPWIESYLQDFFGLDASPSIAGEPVTLHLLAPNKRCVQVTSDLPSFFRTHYPPLRKELGRRYPKHAWPEDTKTPVPMRVHRRPS